MFFFSLFNLLLYLCSILTSKSFKFICKKRIREGWEANSKAGSWSVGMPYMERRLLNALFLTLRNFATFRYCLEHSNSRCPGYDYLRYYVSPSVFFEDKDELTCIKIISAWGSSVARLTIPGNAKASKCRMSNGYSSLRFYVCRQIL